MIKILEQLPLSYQENSGQKMRMQNLKRRCQELADKLTVFLNSDNYICWMERGRTAGLPCVRFLWNWSRFYFVISGAE